MTEKHHKKVTPRRTGEMPLTLVIVAAALGGLMVIIAAAVALSNNQTADTPPTPTTIPAPALANGDTPEPGMMLYTEDRVPLSLVAAPGNESEELFAEPCDPLQVGRSPVDDNFFYFDTSTEEARYWVYVVRTDEAGDGWLPLEELRSTPPDGCQ